MDVNAQTKSDLSPLAVAIGKLGANHEITEYLKSVGAEPIGRYEIDDEVERQDEYDDDAYYDDDAHEEKGEEVHDVVPTIVAIEDTIVDRVPEIVPTIVAIENTIVDRVPEIVPTIVSQDDDEEL